MLFNSFVFIFLFLPITFIAYYGLNRLKLYQWAKSVLVIASLAFYAYFNLSYLPIMVASIVVNYGIGMALNRGGSLLKLKTMLTIGILFNIGLLGYFKYTDFLIENINAAFSTSYALKNILLPLGISFFTFQQLAFVIDSYKAAKTTVGNMSANTPPQSKSIPGFLDYCNFVTFFPQLIAGPIVLPEEMLPQFENERNRHLNSRNILDGLYIFAMGLVKKVLIADSIAVFANAGFMLAEKGGLTMAEAWLTSLSYTFQLYFDFCGYCDMAIGIGLLFNIKLPLNFDVPYRATNFQDFWRRWHMTLNRFLTQYLYIPLGGSKTGKARTYLNILIVFFISGLWHGAGWTFIIWGICHGIGVMICRAWHKGGCRLPDWLGMFITFFFINILWVIFRADNMTIAQNVIRSMFDNTSLRLTENLTSNLPSILPNTINMLILFAAILLAFIGPSAYSIMTNEKTSLRTKQALAIMGITVSIFFVSRVVTFLYFNF